MSNEQHPRDDERGNEPVGYQTGRSYSATEISRKFRDRKLKPTADARALAEHLVAELIQHERDTAARRAAQGDTNPYDVEPYADVHDLARFYDESRANTEDLTDLERFLDNLAEDLDLADVRALRTAAAAAADAMGRIALAHREKGMSPDEIAAQTGYTASRIAQFIRQEKERRAAPGDDQ